MGVKVLYVAGVPACGKSSLMKRVRMQLFKDAEEFKHGKCRGIVSICGKYSMLGVFDGTTFEGTDKLSMTVINDAIDYINTLRDDTSLHVVFVEGDRLFNYRFISETGATLLLLDANDRVLEYRHKLRGYEQTDRFLRSRRTKVENYIKAHGTMRIWNNTLEDQNRILTYLLKTATEYVY